MGDHPVPPTLYPYRSYRDADSALNVLREASGLAIGVRSDDPDGTVQHAEATFGEGTVMWVRPSNR
jgi:uncharacterized glyoxalase superfamily protein PhnB